jgi:hypothetical protein
MYALASLALCAQALAIAPDSPANRYQAIPERNAFGLKPRPVVDSPPTSRPSIPKLILTGITTILGNKLVLMKAVPPGNAPGQAIKEESLMLTEGQRQGDIEVLNIDEKAGSVRVNNSGSIMTLTFEKDGAKLPNTPPLPTTPGGLPLMTNATAVSPAMAPTALPGRRPTHKPGSLPTRQIRSSNAIGPAQAPVLANPVGEPGSVPVPSVANPAPVDLPAGLTPEEQAIVLQMQQQAASQSSTGSAPQTVVPGAPMPAPQLPVLPQ